MKILQAKENKAEQKKGIWKTNLLEHREVGTNKSRVWFAIWERSQTGFRSTGKS